MQQQYKWSFLLKFKTLIKIVPKFGQKIKNPTINRQNVVGIFNFNQLGSVCLILPTFAN